jgi:hypothetical protein
VFFQEKTAPFSRNVLIIFLITYPLSVRTVGLIFYSFRMRLRRKSGAKDAIGTAARKRAAHEALMQMRQFG